MRTFAPMLAYLLTPVAMAGYALALWRLGADMDWTGDFFISDGLLSRWQVWLAFAAATQMAAHRLNNRNGRSGDAAGA
jgi:hypothetical protein